MIRNKSMVPTEHTTRASLHHDPNRYNNNYPIMEGSTAPLVCCRTSCSSIGSSALAAILTNALQTGCPALSRETLMLVQEASGISLITAEEEAAKSFVQWSAAECTRGACVGRRPDAEINKSSGMAYTCPSGRIVLSQTR